MTMYVSYCVGFVSLFVFVLWLVYSVFPVTLNRPFLIAPSVFSNVYVLSISVTTVLAGLFTFIVTLVTIRLGQV